LTGALLYANDINHCALTRQGSKTIQLHIIFFFILYEFQDTITTEKNKAKQKTKSS